MAVARPAGVTAHVESDGYARTRWRGGKRGQPTLLSRDRLDCRIALRSVSRALELLDRAADESLPPHERAELHREGRALAAHAGRSLDEVVMRTPPKSTRPR